VLHPQSIHYKQHNKKNKYKKMSVFELIFVKKGSLLTQGM